MTISGTVKLSGRLTYAPPAPFLDSSANPSLLADVLEQMACSGRKEEEYTLVADGDTVVDLGSLATRGADVVVIKVRPNIGLPPSPANPDGVPAAPNPVVVKLTSAAGTASPISVSGLMFLDSHGVPYTALSLARAPGVQAVVRVLLFSFGS